MTKNGKLWQWYLDKKRDLQATVYYDRYRKGWFFKINEERHGYYGSKDIGYNSRADAIKGLKRYYNAHNKDDIGYIDDGDDDDLVISIKYDVHSIASAKIRQYRIEKYGHKMPSSSSRWVDFIEALDGNRNFNVTEFNRRDMEMTNPGSTFSFKGLLEHLGYTIVYNEDDTVKGLR